MHIGLIKRNTNVDFVGKAKIFFAFSVLLCTLFVVCFFWKGFNLGVDFKGGLVIDIQASKDVKNLVRQELEKNNITEMEFKPIGKDGLEISISDKGRNGTIEFTNLIDKLRPFFQNNNINYLQSQIVGPSVSYELFKGGTLAVVFALLGIYLYIWVRFDWQYSTVAVIALIHDVLIAFLFLIIFDYEVNVSVIAAVLTVIGYSLNDKVVIFDQIRENVRKYIKEDLKTIVNKSINQVFSRSIATSSTLLIVLISIYIFAGSTLKSFSFLLIIGVAFGTYSSICICSLLLLHVGDIKRRAFKKLN